MTTQQESMYIKACVVANGVKDKQDDVISKKDIKKIFTNSIDVGFDIGHDNIRQSGIYSLENYISKQEETIMDHVVPSGSWMTILRVDNTDVQEMIRKGEINGVSITAYPESDAEINRSSKSALLYKDIVEKSQLHPKEISLVESPANNLPLEVMDYDTYISKSDKNGRNTMVEKEDTTKDSTIEKLVDILSNYTHISKQVEEKPVQDDEMEEILDETVKEAEPQEEIVAEEEPEPEVKKEEESEPEPEPVVIEKADEALLRIAELCAEYLSNSGKKLEKSDDEPTSFDNGSDVNSAEKPITEKKTQKYDDETMVEHTDITRLFAEQQGRDPWTFEKL